jgi:hypothetical protein
MHLLFAVLFGRGRWWSKQAVCQTWIVNDVVEPNFHGLLTVFEMSDKERRWHSLKFVPVRKLFFTKKCLAVATHLQFRGEVRLLVHEEPEKCPGIAKLKHVIPFEIQKFAASVQYRKPRPIQDEAREVLESGFESGLKFPYVSIFLS